MNDSTGRAARYADARRLLDLAEQTPHLPFPSITGERAVFHFFTGFDTPAHAHAALRLAELSLNIALGVDFTPRRTEGRSARYFILGAVLESGMRVDLTTFAEYAGPAAREDAAELEGAAA